MKDREQKNRSKARYCLSCIYVHIGIEVDHNHCSGSSSLWYEERVNGHHRDKCRDKRKKKLS